MAELLPGALLDARYRVEARIGQGAHGSVYRALDTRTGVRVAIKHLHESQRASPVGVQRFEREAQYLLALNHPKIVRALAFGRVDGAPYLVCELLEGLSLRDLLKTSGPLPLPVAVAIALDVLDALDAAHAAGIVHRDVKPGNIFLPPPDRPGPARVIDFGIARALERDGAPHLTLTGEAIGTPAYIAPEQAHGDEVRETADVYALGLTLAEMIGGERVVRGSSELSLLVLQAAETPHELNDVVRRSPLSAVIARAIAKRAEARYPSAAAMRAAILERVPRPPEKTELMLARTGELTLVGAPLMAALAPTLIAAPPAPQPRRRAQRRAPIGWLVGAGVAALAAAIVFFATRESPPDRRARAPDHRPAPSAPRDRPEVHPRTAPPPTARPELPPIGLEDLDLDEIARRLRGAGYTLDGEEDFGAGMLASYNVELRAHRDEARAVVTFTRFVDEGLVEGSVAASIGEGYLARRAGLAVLAVRVDDDPTATRELFDAVLGAEP
ncbi:MAG: serine/threonine-protein kinase [Polyangiaceae bacterium]